MRLTGLHILLTFQCLFECDHCFVWGSPRQTGTLTLDQINHILAEASEVDDLRWIYFEGGEPFLYYPVLVAAVQKAHQAGYQVGIVTNGYWAQSLGDARTWLAPFAGKVHDLSVSSDLYHYDAWFSQEAQQVCQAAAELDIPVGMISVAQAGAISPPDSPQAASELYYRGRAAAVLASHAPGQPWSSYTTCPAEDLIDPGRLHLDPLGNLHICQGIVLGNLFQAPLVEILSSYDPQIHPICSPLLSGGPAELVRRYGLQPQETYADACHLCCQARAALRSQFPAILQPDQVYGELAP